MVLVLKVEALFCLNATKNTCSVRTGANLRGKKKVRDFSLFCFYESNHRSIIRGKRVKISRLQLEVSNAVVKRQEQVECCLRILTQQKKQCFFRVNHQYLRSWKLLQKKNFSIDCNN